MRRSGYHCELQISRCHRAFRKLPIGQKPATASGFAGFLFSAALRQVVMTADVTSGNMKANQTRIGNAGAIIHAALRETLSDIAREKDND
jgi:hypothetical protein